MNLGVRDTNLTMTRGDTARFSFAIEDYTNGDLTAAYFSCKANLDSVSYSFQKTLNDGITESDTSGVFLVEIEPSDTSSLSLGTYYYDLELILDGDTLTVMKGRLTLTWEATV